MAEIKQHLVIISKSITNLSEILLYLEQHDIISEDESQEIENQITEIKRNEKLLSLLQKKDWEAIKNMFLEILRETNNEYCANIIEGNKFPETIVFTPPKVLKYIWWPTKKELIKSLYKRKVGDKLLVEYLHERISQVENRSVVICESAGASKLTGMGGVGKTLTANWYAHHYEKEYDHVIWIYCGEDSLIMSFKKLVRDLEVTNRNKLVDLEDYVRNCYEALSKWKCLWIYDNAENYKGHNGIQSILPKDKENFYCLITSRNLEWGSENVYGKLCPLEINIFSDLESFEFLTANLKVEFTEEKLKDLCDLLGNLPLALQLATAALNNGKIDLQTYIQKNRHEKIIKETFDDYEKTISSNVKITLELITKEDNGDIALNMMMIFGYIRADNISIQFFKQILNLENKETENAIELLLKYSLISQDVKTLIDEKLETFLNIHRLLQQVIRHIEKDNGKDILRKILGCNGFLEYKLIPFIKYANEDLRKEFPKVKSALLDEENLETSLYEERFEECVQLSKFIDTEFEQNTTRFNYSLCLAKNRELKESTRILEDLYKKELLDGNPSYIVELGLLKFINVLAKDLVEGHLLVSYWRLGNREKVKEILEKRTFLAIINSKASLNASLEILGSDLIHTNYYIRCDEYSVINIQLGGQVKELELESCSLDLSFLPQTLEKLSLNIVDIVVSKQIKLPNLKYLVISFMPSSCLSHFQSSNELSEIYLLRMKELNVDLLPERVKNIKMVNGFSCDTNVSGGVKQLEKLILEEFSLGAVHAILDHLKPNQLVIYHNYKPKELIELKEKSINKIVIGKIYWDEETLKDSIFCKQVDKKSEYYLIEDGRVKALEMTEFAEFGSLDQKSSIRNSNMGSHFLDSQKELRNLLFVGKFEESVQLAKFIDNDLSRKATKFNCAICLERFGDLETASRILEELYNENLRDVKEVETSRGIILEVDDEVTKELVGGHLLIIHWRMGNRGRMQEFLEERKSFKIIPSEESLNASLEILCSNLISSNYIFQYDIMSSSTIVLQLNVETKGNVENDDGAIVSEIPVPEDLHFRGEIELRIGEFNFNLEEWIPKGLKRLKIDRLINETPSDRYRFEKERLLSFSLSPGWPVPFISAEDLAKAGFFFLQKGDDVQCVFCTGVLSNWEVDDEPMECHGEHFPNCPFILNYPVRNIALGHPINTERPLIHLNSVSCIGHLDLSECSINIINSGNKVSVKKLEFKDVLFFQNEEELKEIRVNTFIDFRNVNKLVLLCNEKKNLLIDMSEDLVTIQYLELDSVRVLNWKETKWNVGKFKVTNFLFLEKTKIKATEIEMKDSSLDISMLPSRVEKLSISRTKVIASGEIETPNLKYLTLSAVSPNCLSHFCSLQITHIDFQWMEELNIDCLPQNVNCIKITNYMKTLSGGGRKLEKLILDGFPMDRVLEVLDILHPKQLVIIDLYEPEELMEVINLEIDTIAIGEIEWEETNFNKSNFSKHMDRKSNFYVFKGGRGKAIEEKEFDELMKL